MPEELPPDRLLSVETLESFSIALMLGLGMPAADAHAVAHAFMIAEVRGVGSHGFRQLSHIHRKVTTKSVNKTPNISEIRAFAGTALLDGDNGLGQVVATAAMSRAIAIARAAGVGIVAAKKSSHFAAAAPYAMMASDNGMVGIAMSNVGVTMAIHGSVSRSIGNNPIAFASPGPDFPIVLDFATSIASWGKIGTYKRLGLNLPEEWFVGPEGEPTESTSGAVVRPFGGPKGSGLAVFIEILTAALAGGSLLSEQGGWAEKEQPEGSCHTMIALDVARFIPYEEFISRVGDMATELKTAQPTPDVDEVLLPGERAWNHTLKCQSEGVLLDVATVEQLNELAQEVGISPRL